MGFKVGDKVALKSNQSAEDEVLALLAYGEVYEVARVIGDEWDEWDEWADGQRITLVGRGSGQEWLARRFQLAAVPRPERGDVVEVTVRAKVAAVQTQGVPALIVYFDNGGNGDGPEDHVAPIYLNSAVQALTIVERAKPKLDLDALPEGTVVQAPTGAVYVKLGDADHRHYPWGDMDGFTLSSSALAARHSELVELVPRGSAASA